MRFHQQGRFRRTNFKNTKEAGRPQDRWAIAEAAALAEMISVHNHNGEITHANLNEPCCTPAA